MTSEELSRFEQAHKAAARRYEATRTNRNAAVVEALSQGLAAAHIARVTGLTRSRISQIVKAAGEIQSTSGVEAAGS